MPPMHSRKSLEAMKRVDLQRLCKEYGVKANLKTEDLIDLLLDSQTPAPPRGTSISRSPPRPLPTRRSASVTQPSQVSGPSRTSSIIVHDIDEEGDEECEEAMSEDLPVEKPPTPPLVPPPRTRKAKELQTRLGKGKPVIAGGSGPRAITASSGSSKGRQTRSSKTMKPREPTIEEEPEALSATTALIKPDTEEPNESQRVAIPEPFQNGPPFGTDQMDAWNSQMSSIKSEIAALQGRILEVSQSQKEILVELRSLRELPLVVSSLKDEVKQLRERSYLTSRLSTPQPRTEQSNLTLPSESKKLNQTTATPSQHPGTSTSTLGKRHRDSTSSVIDGVIEESEQDAVPDTKLAKTVIRPDKKRAKLQMDNIEQNSGEPTPVPLAGGEEESSSSTVGSAFTVYRGAEEPEPPPPTNHLPEAFLIDSSPGPSTGQQRSRASSTVPTSSANASENHPFNFAFAPMSSTPQNPFMTSFPYPEPPQSPSPAGPSLPALSSRQQAERTDIFKEFGFPSPVRPTRNYGALSNDERGINPAALQGPSTKRTVSSNDVAAGLGLTAHRTTPSDQSSEAPTIRRTMYGTELEGDTRFGDFGVEGVASGFWLSK